MFGVEDFSKPIIDYSNFDPSQLGDVLIFGGSILLIGIGTIFAVLCILWLFLVLFKLVFHNAAKRKESKRGAKAVANVADKTAEASEDNSGEIVAVIAAAIAMAESENSDLKFRVVSFKRV